MRAIDAHFTLLGFEPDDRVYLTFNFDLRHITIKPDRSAMSWREQPYGAAAQVEEQSSSKGRFARPLLLDCCYRVNTTESGG
ncbi:hypothetical protein BLA13014_05695 [Burkholderia aenigmatica]|uniref:Uncharacterized protein n=1 Tax=Burkholderia aenigmatica TaxID=2015348 RepID=A0A6P2QF64_9BURK|nr:hypothetical protein [Burkholderia aenigmatica]VWC20469.1 hypothetical protein BLA13014_05695 [Burkholderia aenigmatica]